MEIQQILEKKIMRFLNERYKKVSSQCISFTKEDIDKIKDLLDCMGLPWIQSDYEAEKNGRVFSATNAEELLGIVAMWEVRGDNWQTRPDEPNVWDELDTESKTYDLEGNLLED